MLLQVKNLKTQFKTKAGLINAVNGVNFEVNDGEVVAIVGESGSGKSVTALSLMRLIADPPGKITDGEILFENEDLLKKSRRQMQDIRGSKISMVFQEPMTSLNPIFTIEKQICESLIRHKNMTQKDAAYEAVKMLKLVGIPSPEKRIKNYPHQMSGGMRQRVMIAMALICKPKLLIADEPTTALDVTIQAQILDLMIKLKNKLGTSILLITHDLGVVAETADKVIVMYCGKIVEKGSVQEIFEKPLHPYTEGLIKSIPKITDTKEKLYMIEGSVPNPANLPKGCAFEDRCSKCMDICKVKQPEIAKMNGREVRCFLYEKEAECHEREVITG